MPNYKNETNKSQKYRLTHGKEYIWKTIKSGETHELPWWVAESMDLKLIPKFKNEETEEKHEKGTKGAQAKKPSFKERLVEIKGVGEKSAQLIMAKYTEKELRAAIKAGKEIHNNDRIDSLVKKAFK